MCQGLDVLHECRPSAEPSFGEPRRRPGGSGDAALDPVDDGAGFPADEPVGGRHDLDPDPVGSGTPALGGSVVHDLADRVMHDNDCLAGADHLRGEHRPVEYQVR